jgi:hypothetical protein
MPSVRNEIASYAFVVDIKDDKTAQCYQRYGFRSLTAGTRRLFTPITEIANCFRILMSAFNAGQKHVDIFLTGSGPEDLLHVGHSSPR